MAKKKPASPAPEPVKKGKGKKDATPEPAPVKNKKGKKPEPEPAANDPAKPSRGLAIGDNFGWTGKLPATLVYELCQKQKWGKPQFDMRKNAKGFTGVVKLSWESPKREKVEVVMIPDSATYTPRPTTNEARHFAATYVLFRINYMKNMKLMLPVIFRDYWVDLEAQRQQILKENKFLHDEIYNAHPFQVKLDQAERKAKQEKERAAKKLAEERTKKPTISLGSSTPSKTQQRIHKPRTKRTFPRKVWDQAPFIDFSLELRTKIEQSIRHHLEWNTDANSKVTKEDRQALVDYGFRPQHVDEALEHCGHQQDALEWLLFHIPEDDLPPLFAKLDKDSGVQLRIAKNLQQEYLMARMAALGCDKDDILEALERFDGDEVAASVYLTRLVVDGDVPEDEASDVSSDTLEDLQMLWEQEIEGIEIIGTHKCNYVGNHNHIVEIPLSPPKLAGMLTLRLFKSANYPDLLPGMLLVVTQNKYQLANYIKISAIKQAGEYLRDQVGGPMVFSAVEWMEANIARVIENPGKLVRDTRTLANKEEMGARARGSKRGRRIVVTQKDIDAIKADYTKRQALDAVKKAISGRKKLPAWSKQQQLVDVITTNQVTVVTGETGSGKLTQIVQFILDHLNAQGNFGGKIMCTQPRRISTIGLADRISEERGDKCGQETGYIIRGENKTSNRTRLSFVTTGVLLRMLQLELLVGGGLFDHLEYIFVDEVHERSVDLDFLLIILKKILKKLPKLKVVLMSATIDTTQFTRFFGGAGVNHIHIEGRTFPIEDRYLDDILEATNYSIVRDGERVTPRADSAFFQKGTINYELVAKTCKHIDSELTKLGNSGSILVFMPGIMEISKTIREIEHVMGLVVAVPLHLALLSQDQKKVFRIPPKGTRKVVVSTNIAETSITIPDCVAVVDTGRSKLVFFDTNLNTTRLVENWCSQAEVGQRRGRSGRITNGTAYHMYTRETFNKMIPQPIPEIQRTRLENLFLVVKAMGIPDVPGFLADGLDVPDDTSMAKASSYLHDIGAVDAYGHLTHLGQHLSYLPTDLNSGKLLLMGCIFGCLEPCLVIAASTLTGLPFLNLPDERDEVKRIQNKWAEDQGDLVAMANVVAAYEEDRLKKFITANKLGYLTLQDILLLKLQYLSLLKEIGFVPLNYKDQKAKLNRNLKNYPLLRAVLAGSLYPQIARVQLPEPKFFKLSAGSVAVDPDAKTIKLWIKNDAYDTSPELTTLPASRAFIHPSLVLFGTNDIPLGIDFDAITDENGEIDIAKARELFDMTPKTATSLLNLFKNSFMAYRLSHHTTKLFVRDLTPTSTLGVLMFGGDIDYEVLGNKVPGIVLDLWLPIRTWCKNGVLIKKLRVLLDNVLDEQLQKASHEGNEVLTVIEKFLSLQI